MQVFVKRADLTAATPPDPIPVIATYADDPAVPYATHDPSNSNPSAVTVLYLPSSAVERTEITLSGTDITIQQTSLADDWRNNNTMIVNSEANRRIVDVFPEYKQRNSTATYQQCVTAYGLDSTAWPPEAKTFKDEYDRGWAYVNAVRETSGTLTPSMPPDPTSDTYWPTRIAPIVFGTVF